MSKPKRMKKMKNPGIMLVIEITVITIITVIFFKLTHTEEVSYDSINMKTPTLTYDTIDEEHDEEINNEEESTIETKTPDSIHNTGIKAEYIDADSKSIYKGVVDSSGNSIKDVYIRLTNYSTQKANITLSGYSENDDIGFSYEESNFSLESGKTKTIKIDYNLSNVASNDYSSNLVTTINYTLENVLVGDTKTLQEFSRNTYFPIYYRGEETYKSEYLYVHTDSDGYCDLKMKLDENITSDINSRYIESEFTTEGNKLNDKGYQDNGASLIYNSNIYVNRDEIDTFEKLNLYFSVTNMTETKKIRITSNGNISIKQNSNQALEGNSSSVTSNGITVTSEIGNEFDGKNDGIRWQSKEHNDIAYIRFSGEIPSTNSNEPYTLEVTIPVKCYKNDWSAVKDTKGYIVIKLNIYSYSKTSLINQIKDYDNYAPITDYSNEECEIDCYTKLTIANSVCSKIKVKQSDIDESISKLVDIYDEALKNEFTVNNVITQNNILKTTDMKSVNKSTTKYYRVYNKSEKYKLPFEESYLNESNRNDKQIEGTISENLVKTYNYWKIDTNSLNEKIEELKNIDLTPYTSESIKNLNNTIEDAKKYLNENSDIPLYQSDITSMIEKLENAKQQLKLKEYTIIFKNENGNILEEQIYKYGEVPAYKGETPTKAATKKYEYKFKGWNKEIVKVTEEATYTATFDEILRKYKITFADEDGTVLEEKEYKYGEKPVYSKGQPVKEQDEQYTYKFECWDKEIVDTTEETTYTAKYSKTERSYLVIYQHEDGTIIKQDTYKYSEEPSQPEDLYKESDEQYTYQFKYWKKDKDQVTKKITFTAYYEKTIREYTVTFKNEDGKVITTEKYKYGQIPQEPSEKPTKEADSQYTYEFIGWDKEIDKVIGEATYTAKYKAIEIKNDIEEDKKEDNKKDDNNELDSSVSDGNKNDSEDINNSNSTTTANPNKNYNINETVKNNAKQELENKKNEEKEIIQNEDENKSTTILEDENKEENNNIENTVEQESTQENTERKCKWCWLIIVILIVTIISVIRRQQKRKKSKRKNKKRI